jgi:uncharacterized membrane protein
VETDKTLGLKALRFAVILWYVVTVASQLTFALYVALFYGGAVAQGDLTLWNRTLPKGYVPGETLGNIAIATHLGLAIVILLAGALQLVPLVRQRAPALHRASGRVFLVGSVVTATSGLWMLLVRKAGAGDAVQHLASTLNTILILLFAALAWRNAVARRISVHRRWALRLFVVTGGVWCFRVGLQFWLFIMGGPVGFNPRTFTGPFLSIWTYGAYLLPLLVLELYLRAKARGSGRERFAMALLILICTTAIAIGSVRVTSRAWIPRMRMGNGPRPAMISQVPFPPSGLRGLGAGAAYEARSVETGRAAERCQQHNLLDRADMRLARDARPPCGAARRT